ncbi:MAG: hypothetical protein ABSF83_14695 [Nitrososphaerales archaeon]|jgi:hypothetical protein
MLTSNLSVRDGDLVDQLFNHKISRGAARALLEFLKANGGKCTKGEMNGFSRTLASGRLGVRISRTNFYRTVLSRFVDLQLIAEQLEYDQSRRKAVKLYKVVVQPLGRKPMGPSLMAVAYGVAQRWNEIFVGEHAVKTD